MKIFLTIILLLITGLLFAEDKFSAGVSLGYQHDVGMISERPGIQGDAQQNASAGIVIKLDMGRLFLRSGVEYSYPVETGAVESGGTILLNKTAITFAEVPVYVGINISIRDFGAFYMGGGGSYIFGTGHIKTTAGDVKINEQLFGYGLLAGIETEIYSNASLLFEWEYMTARSSPVASVYGTGYDDYPIDYSGHRVRFGVIYHFNRY